mgnify:FL=1
MMNNVFAPQQSSMVGDIDIQKYRIKSVSMISEASWSPRIIIEHFDGKEFYYSMTRDQIEDFKAQNIDVINKILWNHIKKECPVWLRKEKLEKINSLKFIDIQL